MRELAFTNMSSLIEKLVDALSPHLHIPFALFGHSMGALICFELARKLRHHRYKHPLQLFVAGHRAPHLRAQTPPIHDLPTPLFLEKLGELGGTPDVVLRDPDMMQLFLPLLRADFKLLETYVFNENHALDCPITAFGGLDDKVASEEEMAAWSVHTRETFKLHMFPGGHFFLSHARLPLLRAIAADLSHRMVLSDVERAL
jgi:medium-chain acyl-[acyl-carrier-protein] hydrolase